jgi:phosphopantothenoylcysteine decarboxylase/phosphopantothenate--cysteine ligase
LKCHPDIRRIDVESAEEMYDAATSVFPSVDAAILCAAVADFRPATVAEQKIHRGNDAMHIDLLPTRDIAQQIGKMKKEGQRIVAFALETDHEEQHAEEKRKKKNADLIVLNSTRIPGTTFRSDDNQIAIISDKGTTHYPKKPKQEVAADIIDQLESIL